MKPEVIQDFLTVPGIAGIALIDGLSRPCFHGFGADFAATQQDLIARGIQQVLETTPDGFNSFEFQFDFYRIYLNKLKQGLTLLVLTGNVLPQSTYTQAIRHLLLELQLDQADPIASFRAIAANIPLVWEPPLETGTASTPVEGARPEHPALLNQVAPHPAIPEHSDGFSGQDVAPEPIPALVLRRPSTTRPPNFPPHPPVLMAVPVSSPTNLKDVLAAINALSQLTTQYLGTMVVANYWKSTCPAVEWLHHFQIERSTQMTFSVQAPSQRLPILTSEQHGWLQAWVAAFIERCSKVIRDFAKIVRHTLNARQQALLFEPPC